MAQGRLKPHWHVTAAEAGRAPIPAGRRSAELLRHGSLEVRYYAPKRADRQTPHERDEIYVVASGTGFFIRDKEKIRIGAGDMLFVPANMAHRFEDFSDDFATWVFFYGPEGGERVNPFL